MPSESVEVQKSREQSYQASRLYPKTEFKLWDLDKPAKDPKLVVTVNLNSQ